MNVSMVFSGEVKAVKKKNYEEKGWTSYKIGKEHKSKRYVLISFPMSCKRAKETGTVDQKIGSRRPVTATIEENADLVELLISSQEENDKNY